MLGLTSAATFLALVRAFGKFLGPMGNAEVIPDQPPGLRRAPENALETSSR